MVNDEVAPFVANLQNYRSDLLPKIHYSFINNISLHFYFRKRINP